jgi:4-hydroxythreonine-4-phosphate dehydrogenase
MTDKPLIALTMGDPAGVGPEIVLRALANQDLAGECRLAVFGDFVVLESCSQKTGLPLSSCTRLEAGEVSTRLGQQVGHSIVDLRRIPAGSLKIGQVSAAAGRASFDYIQAAIDANLAGDVEAVSTAPINKEALRAAGIQYPGHTEMFAERAAADRWCMMQYSPEITCTFVTVHVGYAEVPGLLSVERIFDTIELTAQAIERIRGQPARIVVCGLNPHAGEHGLFGQGEEERWIIPAIEQARSRGISVEGPLPPDTAFLPWKRRTTDAFVCMYHDQGHIPVKALAFDSAVNTTLGLPIIRTSVDHGTAYDIAWTGKARSESLLAAIRLAIQLAGKSRE